MLQTLRVQFNSRGRKSHINVKLHCCHLVEILSIWRPYIHSKVLNQQGICFSQSPLPTTLPLYSFSGVLTFHEVKNWSTLHANISANFECRSLLLPAFVCTGKVH